MNRLKLRCILTVDISDPDPADSWSAPAPDTITVTINNDPLQYHITSTEPVTTLARYRCRLHKSFYQACSRTAFTEVNTWLLNIPFPFFFSPTVLSLSLVSSFKPSAYEIHYIYIYYTQYKLRDSLPGMFNLNFPVVPKAPSITPSSPNISASVLLYM